ncbi:MAG TPA: hypothetical protein DCO68_06745 [Methylophilaceae bacterium]|nr:hypothetical protein [Methylophilaceae bacterium]
MNSQNNELIPDSIILGERNYAHALDLVIQHANNTLMIFDQDLKLGDYASISRYENLKHFLSKNALSQLTMVVHDSNYLVNFCPRLFSLLETYGHKMTVYVTNDAAKVAKDCFIVADGQHYIRRVHVDHARFKYALNDIETASSLMMRFNELLDETTTTVSPTQLGL